MKILITGVAGFIGSTLARRLLDEGHEVVGIDALTDYYDPELKRENLRRIQHPALTVVIADLSTAELSALVDVDVIYHLAGQPGVRTSWGSAFSHYARDNIDASQRLLEATVGSSRLRRFVYASSSSVYGDAESYPTRESDLPRPHSPYGVTKLAAEHLMGVYARNFGVPTVSLRYFTVYGPGQRPDMAFTRFIRAALAGDPITVNGDGQQVRDFTFVADVVDANIRAGESDVTPGTVLNVSGGTDIALRDALAIIEAATGSRLDLRYGPALEGDVRRTGGDAGAAQAALGWEPRVGIEGGITQQVEWARQLSR